MQKVKEFCGTKYFTWLLIALGTLGILVYYGKNVPHMNAVWELVDEYGYLANAAYLSGKDWGYFTNMYYGYGYSLWLVPVFWLAKTGMQVIKGAVLLNTMFIILAFWVQIVLMTKLFNNWNRNVIVFIAFVINFYPYLVATDMKVNCECLLNFMIWLCGLLIYQALTTEKCYYFALSGVALVYTFFVHTRAFVFLAAFFLFVAVMLLQKKIKWKNFWAFMISASVFFVFGYLVKNHIIDVIYSNDIFTHVPVLESTTPTPSIPSAEDTTQVVVGNTLSVSFVINKVISTILNITPMHLYSFICKSLYLFAGTAGMFHVGVFVTLRDTFRELKETKRIGVGNGLKMMYAIAACVMALALTISSPGHLDRSTYFFYGRYYEYLIGPMIFIGLGYFVNEKVKVREVVVLLILLFISFYFTLELANYLEAQDFYYDSGRIPAFSLMTIKQPYYRAVVRYSALVTLGLIVAMIVMNRVEKLRYMIPGVLAVLFLLNGHVITKNTVSMHGQENHYYAIATYLHTNCEQDEIYFVNEDVIRVTAYTGIQSLLLNQKLILIEPTDLDVIEPGEWFVTFQLNDYVTNWDREVTKVTETSWFVIYQAE